MLQPQNSQTIIDYRNARYQGFTNQQGNRNNLGILIDDDLSFYVSHWNNNIIQGSTLVYISHGKYIYGKWSQNQPNGLNVFRTGDTVLVGQFQNGSLVGRILVIFEKYNIIAVLQTGPSQQKMQVVQCGKLYNHQQLLKYIKMLNVQMPQHYFSLIKYVKYLAQSQENLNESIVTKQKQINLNECCYFGFDSQGLAIIFNSNNCVVSVGYHENLQLNGYGGKFDGKSIQQGNFQLKQTITYNKKRPHNQIYTIFQKMHKRSLNYKNQFFDSKIKTLGNLQNILRGNIQKIVNFNMKNKIHNATANDLNDSLDYNHNIQGDYQSEKHIIQNRNQMYQKQPGFLKKIQNKAQNIQNLQKQYRNNNQNRRRAPLSPITKQSQQTAKTVRKSQIKYQEKEKKLIPAKKSPIRYKQQYAKKYVAQHSIKEESIESKQVQMKKYNIPLKTHQVYERNRSRSPLNVVNKDKDKVTMERNQKSQRINNLNRSISSVNKPPQRQKNSYHQMPKFAGLQSEQNNVLAIVKKQVAPSPRSIIKKDLQNYKLQLQKSRSKQKTQGRSISKVLKRPNYEDIEERRQRLINQFKQLGENTLATPTRANYGKSQNKINNYNIDNKSQIIKPITKSHQLFIDVNQNNQNGYRISQNQSPCMKQKIISFSSQAENIHTEQSSQGYMPLSLMNQKSKNRNQINMNNKRMQKQKQSALNNVNPFIRKQSMRDKLNQLTAGYTNSSNNISSNTLQNNINNKQNYNNGYSKYKQIPFSYQESSNKNTDKYKISNSKPQHLLQEKDIKNILQNYNKTNNKSSQYPHYSQSQIQISNNKNEQDQINKFSHIQLKYQKSQYKNQQQERDYSPIGNSDVSRKRKNYKYYFQNH